MNQKSQFNDDETPEEATPIDEFEEPIDGEDDGEEDIVLTYVSRSLYRRGFHEHYD